MVLQASSRLFTSDATNPKSSIDEEVVSNDNNGALTVEISQPSVERTYEVHLGEHALSLGIGHILDTSKARDVWKLSEDVHRQFVSRKRKTLDDRVTRCLVLPSYIPLEEQLAESPNSIKLMARQILSCAELAYFFATPVC